MAPGPHEWPEQAETLEKPLMRKGTWLWQGKVLPISPLGLEWWCPRASRLSTGPCCPLPLEESSSCPRVPVGPAFLREAGTRPHLFHPPQPQKCTITSGKKSKLFIYTLVCTLEFPKEPALESLPLLARRRLEAELGTLAHNLGASPHSPHPGACGKGHPSPKAKPASRWGS